MLSGISCYHYLFFWPVLCFLLSPGFCLLCFWLEKPDALSFHWLEARQQTEITGRHSDLNKDQLSPYSVSMLQCVYLLIREIFQDTVIESRILGSFESSELQLSVVVPAINRPLVAGKDSKMSRDADM